MDSHITTAQYLCTELEHNLRLKAQLRDYRMEFCYLLVEGLILGLGQVHLERLESSLFH